MKIIKYTALVASFFYSIIIVSSCKKNLEEKAYSTLSGNAVFNSEDGLKKATLGVYQGFTNNPVITWWRFGNAESGHRYAGQPLFSEIFWNEQNKFTGTPNGIMAIELNDIWSQDYSVIARANTVIGNAGTAVADTTIANRYVAEARFIRGFAYFDLVRHFGGVPIVDKQITSLGQTDLIYGARATTRAVYDFIVADMDWASGHLPNQWTGADAGRISAATAKGMLGKVYLTMAGKPLSAAGYFQKAADVLNQVVGSANEAKYNLALLPDYTSVFSNTNKKNPEIMLAFSYYYSPTNAGSVVPFYSFPRGLTSSDEQTFYGLSYSFFQLFENGDKRRDATVVPRFKTLYSGDGGTMGDSIIYDPVRLKYVDTVTHQLFGFAIINQGLAFGKSDRTPRTIAAGGAVYSSDLIFLRFSDVLLCLAEAKIETGDLDGARQLINRVRARAGATQYADLVNMQARVRLERRLELTGEYTTVFDIRRWGTLPSEIAAMVPTQVGDGILGTYNAKFELYPIPQVIINANPAITQNPGY